MAWAKEKDILYYHPSKKSLVLAEREKVSFWILTFRRSGSRPDDILKLFSLGRRDIDKLQTYVEMERSFGGGSGYTREPGI